MQMFIDFWWVWNLLAVLLAIGFWVRKYPDAYEATLVVIGFASIGLCFKFMPLIVTWVVIVGFGCAFACKPTRSDESLAEETIWAIVGVILVMIGMVVRYHAYTGV